MCSSAPQEVCMEVSPNQIHALGFTGTCSLVAVDKDGCPISTSPYKGILSHLVVGEPIMPCLEAGHGDYQN